MSYAAGWAKSGSPKAQSVFLNRIEDHQSLVGMAPLGAFAVTAPVAYALTVFYLS